MCFPLTNDGAPDLHEYLRIHSMTMIRVLDIGCMRLHEIPYVTIRRLGFQTAKDFAGFWRRQRPRCGANPWVYVIDFHLG